MPGKGVVVVGCVTALVAAGAADAQRPERRAGSSFDASLAQRVGTKMSAQVTDVRCPARVVVARGNSFRCTLTFATGDVSRVIVMLRDSRGRYRWKLTGLLLRDLENHMERTLAESGDPSEVQCPWRRRVRAGDTFRCFGLNTPRTRAYNLDATQRGDGLVTYTVSLRP